MAANPSKREKWPPPKHWRHVWVRLSRTPTPAPFPGLVIEWRVTGSAELGTRRHLALVVYMEENAYDHATGQHRPRYRMDWLDSSTLRPAATDYNQVWPPGR